MEGSEVSCEICKFAVDFEAVARLVIRMEYQVV